MTNDPNQLELDLEFPTYDHYTVKLVKADETVRSFEAKSVDDALNLIEGLRDLSANRDSVTWQSDEPDARGVLMGLAPGGIVYEISVVPTLSTPLS